MKTSILENVPILLFSSSAITGNIAEGAKRKAEKHFPCLEQSSDIHNIRGKGVRSLQESSVIS